MSATKKMWRQRLTALADNDIWTITAKIIAAILFIPLFIPRKVFEWVGDIYIDIEGELVMLMIIVSVALSVFGVLIYSMYKDEQVISVEELVAITSADPCAAASVKKFLADNPKSEIQGKHLANFISECKPEKLRADYNRLMGEQK